MRPFNSTGNTQTTVTVLVVARNEAQGLRQLIPLLLQQDFPAAPLEIIVINDHSTDGTPAIFQQLQNPQVKFFSLADYPQYIHPPAYKKSGIELGVAMASHDLIVVTDADCTPTSSWIKTVVHHYEYTNAVFLASPVLYFPGANLLEKMQETEMMSFMVITGAGIHSHWHDMANGANMAFTKKSFLEVNGYEGNYHFPSGDDMFLIEKMRTAYPNRIEFVKSMDAVVWTKAKPTWPSLIKQRIRWAEKNKGLQHPKISQLWSFVGAFHFMILGAFGLALFQQISWLSLAILLLSKGIADFILLSQAVRFFKAPHILKDFIPLQFWYGYYLLRFSLAVVKGESHDWKREIKKVE